MAAAGPPSSPSSSPRLPSPPPIAEDQTGPQSPIPATSEDHGRLGLPVTNEQAADRRIRPGTKAADMAEGPPLIPLADIDSAFQLNEHLKAFHHSYTHPSHLSSIIPIDRSTATSLAQPPEGIDRALWLYELCRFLVQKVNIVIVAFFADTPPCSAHTCPEMRASEWQYLCAVHDPPKPCCAIDYSCHTLDWAANTLTSPKHFPSRLTLSGETSNPQNQVRQLTNIFRRVYRIFAHAWFQHREMFWRVECKTGLYIFFKTVCDIYELIPPDNYTIPVEAEGEQPASSDEKVPSITPLILRRTPTEVPNEEKDSENGVNNMLPTATARRHRPSPSTGSSPVTTVIEETEEEEEHNNITTPDAKLLVEDAPGRVANLSDSTEKSVTEPVGTLSDPAEEPEIDAMTVGEMTPSATGSNTTTSYFPNETEDATRDSRTQISDTKGTSDLENSESIETLKTTHVDNQG